MMYMEILNVIVENELIEEYYTELHHVQREQKDLEIKENEFKFDLFNSPSNDIGIENRSVSLETTKYGSFVSQSNRQ
jgi:hypothetical protein